MTVRAQARAFTFSKTMGMEGSRRAVVSWRTGPIVRRVRAAAPSRSVAVSGVGTPELAGRRRGTVGAECVHRLGCEAARPAQDIGGGAAKAVVGAVQDPYFSLQLKPSARQKLSAGKFTELWSSGSFLDRHSANRDEPVHPIGVVFSKTDPHKILGRISSRTPAPVRHAPIDAEFVGHGQDLLWRHFVEKHQRHTWRYHDEPCQQATNFLKIRSTMHRSRKPQRRPFLEPMTEKRPSVFPTSIAET